MSMKNSFMHGLLKRAIQTRAYTSLSERLHHDLTTRKIPLFFDYLHPQQSHLLNLSLQGILPRSLNQDVPSSLPSIRNPIPLPIGHHLVYFPPQVSLSQLLPDGTDILHTPGEPFNRRLWAGGNVHFPISGPALDGTRAVCVESIRNVTIKGREGEGKVIVTIERRFGTVPEGESEAQTRSRIWQEDEADLGDSSIIENRDLIFMRSKTAEEIELDQAQFDKPSRTVRAPTNATFRHSIIPTKALLFRFSALTFNAHSIHLDTNYTQGQEGLRSLLVHGPLTLTLLLSVLQTHLESLGLRVAHIEYKNLTPLYVDEELTVCGKPKSDGAWDIWIEGPSGGLSVRGSAKTCPI
ncbi:uncharacterized protein N7483_001711 [Penicillium malachiteum]|uniref:uncharacterized protein n=1 Tax=Penicillium malachiteum TaxID=1324776 RepID=UPI00254806C8|nr:uncharacterized protein N7483_001711 [Penicillium malachiteum]KAJ5736586.1 hypothetical protein N7483_001711 [Penicillium malachiteum]